MRFGKAIAAMILALAAADVAEPSCCTDSADAQLEAFSTCQYFMEMNCGSPNARCGSRRPNWCNSPSGCGTGCLTLNYLVLVDRSSPCYCEDEDEGCACEGTYTFTYANAVACDTY